MERSSSFPFTVQPMAKKKTNCCYPKKCLGNIEKGTRKCSVHVHTSQTVRHQQKYVLKTFGENTRTARRAAVLSSRCSLHFPSTDGGVSAVGTCSLYGFVDNIQQSIICSIRDIKMPSQTQTLETKHENGNSDVVTLPPITPLLVNQQQQSQTSQKPTVAFQQRASTMVGHLSMPPLHHRSRGGYENLNSPSWTEKRQEYDERPHIRWKAAFQDKIVSVAEHKKKGPGWEERRRIRMLESGWTNTIIRLPSNRPPKFISPTVSDGDGDPIFKGRGNYCVACWLLVASGPERVECKICGTVVHLSCMPALSAFSSTSTDSHDGNNGSMDEMSINSGAPFKRFSDLENDSITHTQSRPPTSKSHSKKTSSWICEDCKEDEDSRRQYFVLRHRLKYREGMEMFAVVKVQSFARMVRYRLDFIFAKVGITYLQQAFRTRKAWISLREREEKRHRPFRLRINDVRLFMR